ncbi:DUF4232 domain-containing protein [Streptomyces sp. NPDC006510]|uniref:DUF4232 domain-containing protein n=1 Tax=Streptomyces sp. NPDC006510 TaxID=3155600 RepID=UPI0033B34F31
MRTSIRRPAVLAATAVAALSMTLTACGGDDSSKDNGAAASVSAEQGTSSNRGTGTTGSTTAGSGTSGSTGTAVQAGVKKQVSVEKQADVKKQAGTKAPACTVNDVKISATKQQGVPTTHITLTATNVSGHACTLLQYPLLGFGDLPQTSKDVRPSPRASPAPPSC